TLVGLAVLLVGAQVTVWSATEVAAAFGVSEMVIGITVVAVGTSLPELAASMAGAMKGQPEMALGNVIGSNIFNLTAVLPVAGIIYPAAIYPAASAGGDFWRDFGAVLALCLVLSAVCLWKLGRGRRRLGRVTAVGLLGLYVGYYFLLLG
ncbi:MAG: calcium/sodium antiporter, partial [Cellvibrionales bacterium]|nr:calcium/sodium antiporter [Cellvibrionales bacterium]